ncbi:YqzE family protein [Bacillus sp. BGMRC 2118]|nr:YqzE family protein [Bacillus sp. BGMRC 2118]
MTFNDLVKYVTQQFVTYLDQPKQERKQLRQDRKLTEPPVMSRWFGVLPLGFMLMMKKDKNRKGKLKTKK